MSREVIRTGSTSSLRFVSVFLVWVTVIGAGHEAAAQLLNRADCGALRQVPQWTDVASCQPPPPCLRIPWIRCDTAGRVKELRLSGKGLQGTLPAVWRQLTALQSLQLSGNLITGGLPSSWQALTSLHTLSIGSNLLQGSLPSSWSTLTNLRFLDLSSNRLAGSLPDSWSKLVDLVHLNLAYNRGITGGIPPSWSNRVFLQTLSLQGTQVQGVIPGGRWAEYRFLLEIDAGSLLCGPIPLGVRVFRTIIGRDGTARTQRAMPLPPCPTGRQQQLVSVDGKCGPSNQKRCPGNQCCSFAGWCGTGSGYCSPYLGCLTDYGTCTDRGKRLPVSKDNRCGRRTGSSCPFGTCCNRAGVCGTSKDDCLTSKGCQPKYGICTATGDLSTTLSKLTGLSGGQQLLNASDFSPRLKDPCRRLFYHGAPIRSNLCTNFRIATRTTTLARLAALLGTTSYQIAADNQIMGSANAILPLSGVLAVRPPAGLEVKRWRPTGNQFTGPILDSRYPRPCSGLSAAEQGACFCMYRNRGSFVWPFGRRDCRRIVNCGSGGAFLGLIKCPAGAVAQDQEEFTGVSRCVPRPKGFECMDSCSSPLCFCSEYLLSNGVYLNPYDSTRRTGLRCNWTLPGWFGGLLDCGPGWYFDPFTKACTTTPQTHIPFRRGYSSCEGVPDPIAEPLPTTRASQKGRRLLLLHNAFQQPYQPTFSLTSFLRTLPSRCVQLSKAPGRKLQAIFRKPVARPACNSSRCCSASSLAAARQAKCLPCPKGVTCGDGQNKFVHVVGRGARGKVCQCGILGGCPLWFNKNCRFQRPGR